MSPAAAADESVRVLILGGWSPGPIDALRWGMREQNTVRFYEPSLPMPPVGVRWLCAWEAALLTGCAWVTLLLLNGAGEMLSWVRFMLLLGCVAALPLSIVLLVRGSIRRGIATAMYHIEQRHIDVVVGFSWGGGLACWLLAEHTSWHGPTLLLAPTLQLMASAARRAIPTFQACADPSEGGLPLVHIFHATDDECFCPRSQHRDLTTTGAAMHTCDDVHVFADARSELAILRAFTSCVDEARRRKRIFPRV